MTAQASIRDRSAWLAERRQGIGGSDAAAAVGLSRWRSQLDLYLDKIGEGPEIDEDEKPWLKWGSLLEPIVRQEYCDQTGRTVRVPDKILRHPSNEFAIFTADGITDDDRVYEGKTFRTSSDWGEPGTDQVPIDYMLQAQHGMMVTGLPRADIATLIGGSDFRIYTIEADPELQQLLLSQEAEFWECVKARTPPTPTSMADALALHRKATGTEKEAPDEIAALAEHLRSLKDSKKQLEDEIDAAATKIADFMGEATKLVKWKWRDGSRRIRDLITLATWNEAKGASRFDAKAFASDYPELHAQYLRHSLPQRRFLLK